MVTILPLVVLACATVADTRAGSSGHTDSPAIPEGLAQEEITVWLGDEPGQAIVAGVRAQGAGRHAEAEQHFRRALSLFERHFGSEHFSTLPIASWLGVSLVDQGKYVEGESILRRVVERYEKEAQPVGRRHAEAAAEWGVALWGQQRHAEAELVLRRALGLLEQVSAVEVERGAKVRLFLGDSLTYLGRPAEAEPFLREALARVEKAWGPGNVEVLIALWHLGEALAAQKKHAEAESALRRALSIYDAQPAADQILRQADGICGALGGVLLDRGRPAQAQPVLQRRLDIVRARVGQMDIETQNAARQLAQSLSSQGQKAKAREVLRDHGIDPNTGQPASDINPDSFGRVTSATQARYLEALPEEIGRQVKRGLDLYAEGTRELARGRQTNAHPLLSECEQILRRALASTESAVGTGHIATAIIEVLVAGPLLDLLRYAEAEPHLRRALRIQQTLLEGQGPESNVAERLVLARTWLRLGLALYGQHKPEETVTTFRGGLNLADELGLENDATLTSRIYLGEVLYLQKAYVQAEDQFRRAVATCVKYGEPKESYKHKRALNGVERSMAARRGEAGNR